MPSRPAFIRPQLATLVETPPPGDEWLHETKFDGYRLETVLDRGRARLFTRSGGDWTDRFPTVAAAVERLRCRSAILDGEVVALDAERRSSFQALQQRLSADAATGVIYYAFDLLHQDGRDLRAEPLETRKQALRALLRARAPGRTLRYSTHVIGGGAAAFNRSCARHLEGIVSKRRDAPYESTRNRAWLKVKCGHRQEFVVVGYTEPKGARAGLGALLLGVADDGGGLRYAGRVGTGFSAEQLVSLRERLDRLARATSPLRDASGVPGPLKWVEPRLVAEVSFSEWTDDGLLRHPAFEGLREDKAPRDVRREDTVTVAGITLTHPERVLYADQGLTKRDLAAYYDAIAPLMLPHVGGRPLSLVRCPAGAGGSCFYQKHWATGLPDAVDTVPVKESGGIKPYVVVDDAAGLVSLVQMGVLEFHAWGARADDVDAPDRIVFDLDPGPGVGWARVRDAAVTVRDLLKQVKLASWLKTTGGKGLHVVVPIERRSTWDEVAAFARAVAERLANDEPKRFLAKAAKSARANRIFIDWLRNTRGATSVAPWSTRARTGAPISLPIAWDQLDGTKSADAVGVEDVPALVHGRYRDPWEALPRTRQRLPRDVVERLSG